jgi:hypothetical protein
VFELSANDDSLRSVELTDESGEAFEDFDLFPDQKVKILKIFY